MWTAARVESAFATNLRLQRRSQRFRCMPRLGAPFFGDRLPGNAG
jgi:hypothetical protein